MKWRASILAALAALLGARSAAADDRACIPGQQLACACPGGDQSVQVCAADGLRLEPCQCVAPPPPATPPPVMSPPRVATHGGPSTALLVTGLSLFFTGYVATVGINFGACSGDNPWSGCDQRGSSLIPVAGPFTFVGTPHTEPSYNALMVITGLLEVGGVACTIAGLVMKEKPSTAVRVVPMVSLRSMGASLSVSF